jgi:hypothetical protein
VNILSRIRGSVTNNNGFWIGWLDLSALGLQLQSIITSQDYECLLFHCDEWRTKNSSSLFLLPWMTSVWRITPPCVPHQSYFTTDGLPPISSFWRQVPFKVKVKVTLRLTVSQSVCLGVEPRLGLMTRCFFLFETVSNRICYVSKKICNVSNEMCNTCATSYVTANNSRPMAYLILNVYVNERIQKWCLFYSQNKIVHC